MDRAAAVCHGPYRSYWTIIIIINFIIIGRARYSGNSTCLLPRRLVTFTGLAFSLNRLSQDTPLHPHNTHTIYSNFLLYLYIFSLALFTVAVAIRNCLGATASGTGTTTTRTERKWRYH